MLRFVTKQAPPLNYLWVQVRLFDFGTRAERMRMHQTCFIYRTEVAATLLASAKGLVFFVCFFFLYLTPPHPTPPHPPAVTATLKDETIRLLGQGHRQTRGLPMLTIGMTQSRR